MSQSLERPPAGVHVAGTARGEERVRDSGKEPGRNKAGKTPYRTARDSTSINPEGREPIDPSMPHIPPS
jgi:hypothetical protein